MAQPYVGEIRMFAGNFPPNGWMFCQGQTMSIAENEVLFQLIGTTYGGDGQETFMLPNLASRLPMHMGTSTADGITYQIGEQAGVEQVTLSTQQIPQHTHPMMGSSDPAQNKGPGGGVFGRAPAEAYTGDWLGQAMSPSAIGPVGGSQPHENMQPFLCINFIISLFGVFPTQT